MNHVVTAFCRHDGRILLARRSGDAGTYPGRWAGISGYVEGSTDDTEPDARREVSEETGLTSLELVRAGDPLHLVDGDDEWMVHPFLFDTETRDVRPNEELAATEWVHPTAIRDRATVPELWETYRRVAPTLETVQTDETHGAAWISIRALEVLRDGAAEAKSWDTVAELADALRDARPSMAAVTNRINRVMAEPDGDPKAVCRRAERAIDAAVAADREAAAVAVERLETDAPVQRVATLSRSGTVLATLRGARPAVFISESHPGGEGKEVAEALANDGLEVTLTTDAAGPGLVLDGAVDAVLFGADSVLATGDVVNKVGSVPLALAAARASIPVYAVCARDKIRGDDTFVGEGGGSLSSAEGVTSENPIFEVVPADLVTGVITEWGVLDAGEIATVAAEHAELGDWADGDDGSRKG
ncbi:NUDIX domain-containing protein [Haloferax namakaokahaiae]|uniref:NUDIX domain-containing protein n=1 Tax=Haloferax namakaokahaiae TaxID=1748331 RepID=A0ABD5ZCW3_9EURY